MVKWPWKKRETVPDEIRYPVPAIIAAEDMDDEQRSFFRQAAELEAKFALEMRDLMITEMITSARWLQASLLLVNGGAGVALLGSDLLPANVQAEAGAAFVVGVMLALLNALLGIVINTDGPLRTSQVAGYWTAVGVTLQRAGRNTRTQWGSADE
jgi:hypothetical protein